MDLLTAQTAILAQLRTMNEARTVETFAGDIEELFRDTSPKPGLHLLYAGTAYGEQETLGAPVQPVPTRQVWTVLIAVSGRKSAAATDGAALELIAAVQDALAGYKIGNDHVWPEAVEFLKSKNGVLIYGADFHLDTED
ncbi:Gp37 family protein [Desulfobulbus elongatus]|uniref:Gp37 family protein n=1 Tax=Desulfobulbus elongatus TaxID=53332 RepID=UPI000482E5DC|nr:Gp37 family protein [Desulfobulbus elongatus]